MPQDLSAISKFLSYVLRHKPEAIGLTLDAGGWASIDELIAAFAKSDRDLSYNTLMKVVEDNNKQRFAILDGRIRASQGHSIEVDLGLEPTLPPAQLFHGTATRFLESILVEGLVSGDRRFVHLSVDRSSATEVGQRHGKPVVLTIEALKMHQAGHIFFLSENGVWLTSEVPADYISQ